jgi:Zn-dependent protease
LSVSTITLFILGGVSNLAEEPENPGVEFAMAIVGPLSSIALGFIFWIIWYLITKTWVLPVFSVNITASKQTMGLAIVGFLAYTNIILAIFNLLPGFPLDGGRVFRSIIWRTTGNLYRATNIASIVGRVFGWGFIALGVVLAIFTQFGFLNGLWFVFVGWFLNSAADNSRSEVTLREHLTGVLVEKVMEKDVESVRPDTMIDYLVQTIFIQKRKRAVPVVDGDNLVGVVTISDIKGIPQEKWPITPVLQVMHRAPIHALKPEDDLNTAMKLIAQYDLNQVPVLNQGKLVGMLTRADVINYLQLSQELNIKNKHKTNSSGPAVRP